MREARYLQVIGRYERQEIERFACILAVLVGWLECGFADCLGDLFMSLEMGDAWKGQLFTPFHVSSLMARMTIGDAREHVGIFDCTPCGARTRRLVPWTTGAHPKAVVDERQVVAGCRRRK